MCFRFSPQSNATLNNTRYGTVNDEEKAREIQLTARLDSVKSF